MRLSGLARNRVAEKFVFRLFFSIHPNFVKFYELVDGRGGNVFKNECCKLISFQWVSIELCYQNAFTCGIIHFWSKLNSSNRLRLKWFATYRRLPLSPCICNTKSNFHAVAPFRIDVKSQRWSKWNPRVCHVHGRFLNTDIKWKKPQKKNIYFSQTHLGVNIKWFGYLSRVVGRSATQEQYHFINVNPYGDWCARHFVRVLWTTTRRHPPPKQCITSTGQTKMMQNTK